MRIVSVVAAVALLAPFAFAADGAREVQAPLRHAENDYQPHAHGSVGLRDGSDFQSFTVWIEGVGADAALSVQIGDGHDGMADVGAMSGDGGGRKLALTTLHDGHLPLDAAHAGDLSGRAVRIVDRDGHAILVGTAPKFEDKPAPDPKPEPKPEPTPTEKPTADVWAKAAMVRPEHSPYDDSRGVIFVVKRADSEALGFEVGHLAPQTHYAVYLGDDQGGAPVGDFTTNGEGGASVVRDTAKGGELPGNASLADLAGRHIEVRHDGDVVLLGAIPHVEENHDVERVHEDAKAHDETSGADVHVVVDIHPHKGHEACRLDMAHLPTHENADHHDAPPAEGDAPKAARRRLRADVFMDDGTGTLQQIGSAPIGRHGRARLRFTTRHGRSLPLSAATLRELSGRSFEVRVNGTRYVAASMPNL